MCISKVSASSHISKKKQKQSGLIHEGHITLPLEWDITTYNHMQSPPSQLKRCLVFLFLAAVFIHFQVYETKHHNS